MLCAVLTSCGSAPMQPGSQPAEVAATPTPTPALTPGAAYAAHEWVTREVKAPRVSFHAFESAAAKTKVSYHVYVPRAYALAQHKDRRFPVVYWLHGSGGGGAGVARVAAHFDAAIEAGRTPACLVVFVNGLFNGMYVDWKDGSAPVETVICTDLVTHIDATFRTVASRQGRMLDGFSMGGYGAARLGFKHVELFRAVSIVGAGPMQAELVEAPRAGRQRARALLEKVYGGDQAYFRQESPAAARAAQRRGDRVGFIDSHRHWRQGRDLSRKSRVPRPSRATGGAPHLDGPAGGGA